MDDFLYKDKTYQIIGVLFEVHKNLGKGFSEIVYKDAIEFEFQQANIPYEREKEYVVNYKNTVLKHKFYADFIVNEDIVLEVKAVKEFSGEHTAQVLNYMKLSESEIGLLVNFQNKSLQHKRLVF